jgi:hypothetical protein
MSPLGRLLDYLSNRYRVLFLVSAGNILDHLPVATFNTSIEFEAATPTDREQAILNALIGNKSQRTLLSPAESLNALTIGAAHSGSAFNGNLPYGRTDPFTDEELPDIDRVLDCTENRATLLGVGSIAPETSLLYRVPLPDGLDGVRALRAITITLAWFSPVNPRHQGYKMAALDVASGSDQKFWIAPQRSLQPTDKATARGTVFHERRTGEAASVFVDDGNLLLRVTCRAAAGNLTDNVPYALAISMEVSVEAGIPVYDQVRVKLAQPVPAAIIT